MRLWGTFKYGAHLKGSIEKRCILRFTVHIRQSNKHATDGVVLNLYLIIKRVIFFCHQFWSALVPFIRLDQIGPQHRVFPDWFALLHLSVCLHRRAS